MSLVRDYEDLLANGTVNRPFDEVFSLETRSIHPEPSDPMPLDDRFDVVPCDPTQSSAIAEAMSGESYIIQGPPGTGKSQTITNLIANYVARGKRVLFVCEKRAAIDVVFARLKHCGLDSLGCLIHDSQADKKEFIEDLKRTYESHLANLQPSDEKRTAGLEKLKSQMLPLQQFAQFMQQERTEVGISNRQLLEACLAQKQNLPKLDVSTRERLPQYAQWMKCKPAIAQFVSMLSEIGSEPIYAKHPLRLISPAISAESQPLTLISHSAMEARKRLMEVEQIMCTCGVTRDRWESYALAADLVQYARRLMPLAINDRIELLDSKSELADSYRKSMRQIERIATKVRTAEQTNQHWRVKLSPEETTISLDHAAAFDKSYLNFFKPSWWKLRSVLLRSYNFAAHQVKPGWLRILQQLNEEHELANQFAKQKQNAAQRLGLSAEQADSIAAGLQGFTSWLKQQSGVINEVHQTVLTSPQAATTIQRIASAHDPLMQAEASLSRFTMWFRDWKLDERVAALDHINANMDHLPDFVEGLKYLRSLPSSTMDALRSLPLTVSEIEASTANHAFTSAWLQDKNVKRFDSKSFTKHSLAVENAYESTLSLNAIEILQRIHQRPVESVTLTDATAAKLDLEARTRKASYKKGRRELEHEFGKKMRYKPIRDLVSGETGEVIKDLKHIWLMSPLSVSDTLPLDCDHFDVVIFDEACQITLEEAIPSLFRAAQSIIVGDEMQLLPTDFFANRQSDDDETMVEYEGDLIQYDLESGSLLSHAAKNMSSTMLGWHYRSRSESLISFSNWAFYDGRLLTVPDEALAGATRKSLVAKAASDGMYGGKESLDRAISFHAIPYGIYETRRNQDEAEYIAQMVRSVLLRPTKVTIGIIAFSEAQQDEIEQALASPTSPTRLSRIIY